MLAMSLISYLQLFIQQSIFLIFFKQQKLIYLLKKYRFNHTKGTQKGIKVKVDNIFDEFHTYSVDWNANRLKFYIDDKETFSYYKESDAQENSWPFDNEMNIIINTAIGGQWVIYSFK
jgi:beta-glucanase (GH16 family)